MPALESLELVEEFPIEPAVLQRRWLDPGWHAQFTGGAIAVIEPVEGGEYSAWDGYISGATLEITPGRVLQTRRSGDFSAEDADSRLELLFEQAPTGTRLTLRHSEIPAGQAEMYRSGWEDHYLVHMRACLR